MADNDIHMAVVDSDEEEDEVPPPDPNLVPNPDPNQPAPAVDDDQADDQDDDQGGDDQYVDQNDHYQPQAMGYGNQYGYNYGNHYQPPQFPPPQQLYAGGYQYPWAPPGGYAPQQGYPEAPPPDPVPKKKAKSTNQIPDEVKEEKKKKLKELTDKIVAQLVPTRKQGPEVDPAIKKFLLEHAYAPKTPMPDKQVDEIALSIDLPKDFGIGPVPLTNTPIYTTTNPSGQKRDRRYQRLQNLLLSSQAGIAYSMQHIIKNSDDPTWEAMTKTSMAMAEAQRILMQMRIINLKSSNTSEHLKWLFMGQDAKIRLFGDRLFDKTDEELLKLAQDRYKIHSSK
jgi:hypothetical protein